MITVNIDIPSGFVSEKAYICRYIFEDCFGWHVHIGSASENYRIQLPNGAELIFVDSFFKNNSNNQTYISDENIPQYIKFGKNAFMAEPDLPIIYGNDDVDVEEKRIMCGIDVVASIFYMLTRWEEVLCNKGFKFVRFPANKSLAYKYDFLARPVVDEYIEMIFNMIRHLCPLVKRKELTYQQIATHDVDVPFMQQFSLKRCARKLLSNSLLRRDMGVFLSTFKSCTSRFIGDKNFDPYNTFGWLMDVSERIAHKSHFYFMMASKSMHDEGYAYDEKVEQLLKQIIARGHEVGFHPSYHTFNDERKWNEELDGLKRVVDENVIAGGRQHYLNFSVPRTWRYWANAGMTYDSSMGYAEVPGFRCGTCRTFKPFDIEKKVTLSVLEKPLIVMDGTLTDRNYMNMKLNEETLLYVNNLKQICKKYRGNFVLLWHNSELQTQRQRKFYEDTLMG